MPAGNYQKFLEEYTGKTMPAGNFVDKDGNILGQHKGITCYTDWTAQGLKSCDGLSRIRHRYTPGNK